MIESQVDAVGGAYQLTTTLEERASVALNLANTGLISAGSLLFGAADLFWGGANASGGFVLYPNKQKY